MKKVSRLQIAENYAQALYEAAKREKSLDKVYQDCKTLARHFYHLPDLKQLSNPVWKPAQKSALMREISQSLNLAQTTANFLDIVAQNGRLSDINEILAQFKHVFYQAEGIMEVKVESVQNLTAGQEAELKKLLENHLQQKIVFDFKINPQILGGLIVQFGSTRIDDSLSGKLTRLEKVMKGNI